MNNIVESKITHNKMKKVLLTIVAVLTMAITPAMAQIFLDDEYENVGRNRCNPPGEFHVMVPSENVNYDQYVPVGEGLVLLTGLGVAYLLGKRKKNE